MRRMGQVPHVSHPVPSLGSGLRKDHGVGFVELDESIDVPAVVRLPTPGEAVVDFALASAASFMTSMADQSRIYGLAVGAWRRGASCRSWRPPVIWSWRTERDWRSVPELLIEPVDHRAINRGPVGLDRYGVVHPRPTLDEHRPVYPAVPYEVGDLAVVVHEKSEDLGAVRLGELGLT
jgi:hypothetical protein